MAELQRNFHILSRCGVVGTEFPKTGESMKTMNRTVMMTNEPLDGLYPPGVEDEKGLAVNQVLQEWEGEEMVPPAITELRFNQRGKENSHSDYDESDAMLPPGVS